MQVRKRGPYIVPFLALLLSGLAVFSLLAYWNYKDMLEVVRYNDVRRSALSAQLLTEKTLSLLKDLETGQRGFLLTGEDSFLEPYRRMQAEFGAVYGSLRSQLPDTVADRITLDRLNKAVQACILYSETAVNARRERGTRALGDMSMLLEGKHRMDAVRSEIEEIEWRQKVLERASAESAKQISDTAARTNIWLAACGTLMILMSAAFFLFERSRRDHAEAALHVLNESLGAQVEQRTVELNSALTAIKSFAREMDRGVEAERKRLAREVHDQLGQIFTALRLILHDFLERAADAAASAERSEAFQEAERLLAEGSSVVRRISSELRPTLLDDFGLAAALEHHAEYSARRGGLSVKVDVINDETLNGEEAIQLFRIAQEAVTNVIRHAGATEAVIAGVLDDNRYVFTITDNGKGPGSVRPGSHGMVNMRERAALVGAEFGFGPRLGSETGRQRGTIVRVVLPKKEKEP